MFLNAHISVLVNNKPLKYINRVEIHTDSQTIGGTCDILVPLQSLVQYEQAYKQPITVTEITECATAFPIVVKAKYDGYETVSGADSDGFITVFKGYIYDLFEGTPVTIKCMDNFYLFNLDMMNQSFPSITLVNLIEKYILPLANSHVTSGNEIKLIKPTLDLNLENISFPLMTGGAILSWLKKEMNFNVNLTDEGLYVNIASNTVNTIKLKTDINVIRADLQRPSNLFLNIKVKAWFIREDSTKDFIEVGSPTGQLREVFFYNVQRPPENTPDDLYHQLANNAYLRFKQMRYNGNIEMFLYPACELYWRVEYEDVRYPDRNAVYVITAQDIKFSESGFHRFLKLAYLADTTAQADQIERENKMTTR